MNFKNTEGVLARLLVVLMSMGLKDSMSEHRPGCKHVNSDALAGILCQCVCIEFTDCHVEQSVISSVSLSEGTFMLLSSDSTPLEREKQRKDLDLLKLISLKESRVIKLEKPALSAKSAEYRVLAD